VKLRSVMARTSGAPAIPVGLIDGPVATGLADLAGASIRNVRSGDAAVCGHPPGEACAHGTFMAGILVARRESPAPAICPRCPLLVYPIFSDAAAAANPPEATAGQVAEAIVACVAAGARVLNLSVTTRQPSTRAERELHAALDYAAARGALVVASAGNQATLGSWAITRHPWVVPVASYDLGGRPTHDSNLGGSVGRRGLGAPGDAITSLGPDGRARTGGGTSCAAAFVSGATALLWSLFPAASASQLRAAITHGSRRGAVAPPPLNAEAVLSALATLGGG
jgi:subtilisin family serine protease